MPTAFLDRDGVINRKMPDGDYVKAWAEFEFLPGAKDALCILKQHGFRLIVITNQRGVSIGSPPEDDLQAIHRRMESELRKAGATLDAVYYCPHAYNSCQCRKPGIGLFLEAQRDFPEIDFSDSFVIGDSAGDMEAAERLGCRKVLVGNNASGIRAQLEDKHLDVDFSALSLLEAVKQYLLRQVPRQSQAKCCSGDTTAG